LIFTKIETEGNTFVQNLRNTLLSGFNGIFASLKSQNFSFTSTFSTILENDRAALLAYREAINNNVPAAEAFNQTMMGASVAAQEFAKNNTVNILGIQNFTKAQKEAAVAAMAQNKSFSSCKTLIQEYSTGCKNCGLSQEQFVAAIDRSNPALARYLAGLNGAKGSLGGYILSLAKSKIATIALQAATIALNMALTMGISLAIQAVVTGLNNLIHSAKNASEAADDLKSKSLEEAKAMQDEVAQLDELIEKYKELANKDVQDSSTRNEIRDVQSQIVDLVGQQANNLDLVNGKLDDELDKLLQIQKQEADKAVESATNSYHTAQDSQNKAIGQDSALWIDGYAYVSDSWWDNEDDVIKILQDNGFSSNVQKGGVFNSHTFVMDNMDEDMQLLEGAAEKAELLQRMIDTIKDNYTDYASSDIYNALIDQRDVYLEYVDDVNAAAKALANAVIVSSSYDSDLSKIGVDSAETFGQYRDKLIEIVKNSPDLSEALADGSLSNEDIEQQVTDYLSTLDNFSDYYTEWYNTVVKKQKVLESFDPLEGAAGALSPEQSDAYDKVKEQLDSLSEEELEIAYKLIGTTDFSTFEELEEAIRTYQPENTISFSQLINNESFSTTVDDYINKVTTLQDALAKFNDGTLENSDIVELIRSFPELAGETDNLGEAIQNIIIDLTGGEDELGDFTGIYKVFQSQFNKLDTDEDRAQLQAFMDTVLKLGKVVGSTEFAIDIETETNGMENLWTAMKESVSSTGLTAESIKNLKARYQDLENYDAARLFEKTANGIHLNTKALRELESEYEKQTKTDIDETLDSLIEQYNDLTEQINNASDTASTAELYAKRNDILNQINDTAELASMYDGLTSAFKRWEQAQSIGEEGDMYDSLTGGLEHIKELYDEGLIGTNEFRAAVQLMSNEDLSTANIDELIAAYENGYGVMTRYFQDSSDGCINFLRDVQSLNSEWAHMNEDGSWEINFGVGSDQEVADALGINVESVQAIMRKLSDYGFDINLDSIFSQLDNLQSRAEQANQALIEIGATDITFNFGTDDIDYLNEQIEQSKTLINSLYNNDGELNVKYNEDDVENAIAVIERLIYRKQSLDDAAILKVDTSTADSDVSNIISKLQEFKSSYNNLEVQTAIGADTTEAKTACDGLLTEISGMDAEILATLGIDTTSLDTLNSTVNAIEPEVMVKAGLDASLIEGYQAAEHNAEGTVIWDNNIDKVTSWINQSHTAKAVVNWENNTRNVKTYFSATGVINWANNGVRGRAQGTAYSSGNWGTKDSGVALGGEIGQELVVRNGKFFTIGDDGAEFFNYKKGDIVFNAEQTRQILQNGKITNGKKRGVSYAEGTAFSSGSGKITGSGKVITTPSGNGKSNGSSGSDSSSQKENEPEVIDWIEVAIDRIERAINRLKTTAESTYKSLKTKLGATADEITKVNNELSLQSKAYDRYIQQANSVGLSSDLAAKVQDGTIDISEYDKDTAALIKDYQEWYEKALDCSDAIQQLHESLASLYEDNFDNIQTDFDNQLSLLEHLTNTYESGIDMLEARGYLESTKYYSALSDVEKQNVSILNQELANLQRAFSEAMNSGEIEEYSEAWYSMQTEINGVKEAIADANVQMAEYAKTMREIEWSYFDYTQDRISQITQEADFLIDLMSNSDLYDDRGQFNNAGTATMGLHAQNYNTHMAQADQYAQEILELDKQIADDPYNTDLIERREELLGLQQDSILAAEDEKQAIVDMVRDGIEIELEALKELIDAYTDALDSAKDLYDYQKKVKDQTSEISSLQKQLAAYENDTSEETRATVQKLKVKLENAQEDLQETEYEKYISDQKALLDELYLEYEEILNQRLDNVEALISDMIDVVNEKTDSINQTLVETADSVGYTMTDNMQRIWDGSTGALDGTISKYGDRFTEQFTAIQSVLSSIQANTAAMISESDSAAKSTTDNTSSTTTPDASVKTPVSTPTPPASTPTPTKTISIGGKINAGGAPIYDYAGDNTGEHQYFSKDPIYTVLKEQKGYLQVRWHKLNSGITGWFKKSDVKAYKTGGLVDYTGLAKVDGTPGKPELMLNAEDTANFLELRDALRTMSQQQLSIDNATYSIKPPQVTNIADIGKLLSRFDARSIDTGTTITFGDIKIDHVEDYNDFVTQLRNDPKFEKMVKAMTIDRFFGKSSLAKYNYEWKK